MKDYGFSIKKPECQCQLRGRKKIRLCRACHIYVKQDECSLKERVLFRNYSEVESVGLAQEGRPSPNPGDPLVFERLILLGDLPKRQAEVLKLYFQEGLTFEGIGKKLGISRQTAHEYYQLAVKKMSSTLTNSLLVGGKYFKFCKLSRDRSLINTIKSE